MKPIYIINIRYTGCNGNIIDTIRSAYSDTDVASKVCDELCEINRNDPNYLAYVSGPIILHET